MQTKRLAFVSRRNIIEYFQNIQCRWQYNFVNTFEEFRLKFLSEFRKKENCSQWKQQLEKRTLERRTMEEN